MYQQQQWKSQTLRGNQPLPTPRWVLHEEGWHPKGPWPAWHPVSAMCEPWSRFPLLLLLFYRRHLLKAVICFQGRWVGDPTHLCILCPIKGPGKAFFSRVSQQDQWNLMESSVHRRPFCCAHTENRLRGRTLAGKQVAFQPHWVGLTFHSEEFTLEIGIVSFCWCLSARVSVFFHQHLRSLQMPVWS